MKRLIVALSLPLAAALTAPTLAQDKPALDAKALFEQKCSTCHPADRATGKKKTAAEWQKTVTRMKDVNGCPITADEAKTIAGYLASHYGP